MAGSEGPNGGTTKFNTAFDGRRINGQASRVGTPFVVVMMVVQSSDDIGRCYDEHGAAVYAYVRGMVGPARAEAITRDAFVELLREKGPAVNGSSVRTALLAASDRLVIMELRGRQDDARQTSDRIESALAGLSQDDRRAVLFVAHSDDRSQTAAEVLQLSLPVMATRVQSGLRLLGVQLSAHG